jgi:hypothetical protein
MKSINKARLTHLQKIPWAVRWQQITFERIIVEYSNQDAIDISRHPNDEEGKDDENNPRIAPWLLTIAYRRSMDDNFALCIDTRDGLYSNSAWLFGTNAQAGTLVTDWAENLKEDHSTPKELRNPVVFFEDLLSTHEKLEEILLARASSTPTCQIICGRYVQLISVQATFNSDI